MKRFLTIGTIFIATAGLTACGLMDSDKSNQLEYVLSVPQNLDRNSQPAPKKSLSSANRSAPIKGNNKSTRGKEADEISDGASKLESSEKVSSDSASKPAGVLLGTQMLKRNGAYVKMCKYRLESGKVVTKQCS